MKPDDSLKVYAVPLRCPLGDLRPVVTSLGVVPGTPN